MVLQYWGRVIAKLAKNPTVIRYRVRVATQLAKGPGRRLGTRYLAG